MRLLLDTHALIWWLSGDDALSLNARIAIADEADNQEDDGVDEIVLSREHRSVEKRVMDEADRYPEQEQITEAVKRA